MAKIESLNWKMKIDGIEWGGLITTTKLRLKGNVLY